MPTYEYTCTAGHHFEAFQKISERPKSKCPKCGKPASRKISGGAGLVFKGSGFYITDYGKDGKGPRKEPADSGASTTTAPAAESKAGSKPADKKPAPSASAGKPSKPKASK